MMKTLFLLTLALLFFTACQNNTALPTAITTLEKEISKPNIIIPEESSQLLVVTTKNWDAKNGTLQRYVKSDGNWKKEGKPINVILGRNGLGWGVGLHSIPNNAPYIKREGDGKAPAGLFKLGHGFGYNDYNIEFPYTTYKKTDHCVDDSNSQWYNQIIDSTKIRKDYKSFEHMRLNNNLYKYGITVEHNNKQTAYAGSCIFMHIRSGNGKGTAGCTAMAENEIMNILKWLKKERKPLLLQLPKEEILKVTF